MKKNKVNKVKNDAAVFRSVFVLRMKYASGKIKYPATLQSETLGYFNDLEKAEYFIAYPDKEMFWFLETHPFKIYEIEEYGLNYFMLETRIRIYDSMGKFYGEHPADYDKGYPGRDGEDCKFQPGDWVEFVSGNRLDAGIVLGMPPDKKSVKEICGRASKKAGMNLHPFDSSDDCYYVLTGYGRFDHDHPQVFMVFKPSGRIKGTLKRHLTTRYQKYVSSFQIKK